MRSWHGNLSPFGTWHTGGRAATPAVTPAQIFAQSEPGFWYDPSDLTTLFQDTAGTTPVTSTGQSVALVLDKSGRNNHATQATLSSRPTYQVDSGGRPFLSFDGVDDFLVTPTITPGIDKAQVFVGLRKISTTTAAILEYSTNAFSGVGTLAIFSDSSVVGTYSAVAKQSVGWQGRTPASFASPVTSVLTELVDFAVVTAANQAVRLRANGTQQTLIQVTGGNMGQGNFSAYPFYIGRRGGTSLPFNGRMYSLIARFGANLDVSTISGMETWVNGKTGAY